MVNFEYYAPTKVVFGKNSEAKVGELIKEQGCTKVLVHFGGESAKKSGLLDRIFESLKACNIDFVTLGGVVPNPRLSKVYEGIELCRKENVDFILAVGGGSVIDSSKAIGYGLKYDGDVWDLYAKKAKASGCIPIGAVLTIAAAGSEMSDSSVITNEDGWIKCGYSSNYCRCKFAILNPELTYSLPAFQTACGSVDILMHTMERYFTKEKDTQLTDELAEGLMRTVIAASKVLVKNPTDYNARAQIMWASSLSHNDLTGCGTVGDWACHLLGHELSGLFDKAHGAALSSLWCSWARYVYKTDAARFAQFAVKVMGVTPQANDEETALLGISEMEKFYHEINMPANLRELGLEVSEELIDKLATRCSFNGNRTIGVFKQLAHDDIHKIYSMAGN